MNILFLTLSPEIKVNCSDGVYNSVLFEIAKHHKVYIVAPVQRREKKDTSIIKNGNYTILNVKTGNITKSHLIEKGIATLMIQGQYKKAINKYFKDVKFDLILYSTPPITFYSVINYIKTRDGSKTYLMLKDIFPQNAVDLNMMGKNGVLYKHFRKQEINLYKISDRIGCMSPKNKEYLLDHNPYLKKEKVEIFPNSVSILKDNESNLELKKYYRKKYNIPKGARVFIYGGNLGKPQDVPFIIDCLKKVSSIKDAFFVICGNGTDYSKMEEFILASSFSNILLLKNMPKEEYKKFLNIGDVGLLFLDYRFTIPNFPSRLLDYMEKGMSVLACTDPNTDVGDIIEDNGFGWKCYSNNSKEFKAKVEEVCELSELSIRKMGLNGVKYLRKHYNSVETTKLLLVA